MNILALSLSLFEPLLGCLEMVEIKNYATLIMTSLFVISFFFSFLFSHHPSTGIGKFGSSAGFRDFLKILS